jgi:excinuclease ABC subunit A
MYFTYPPIKLLGIRQNNLKNINIEIPQKKLTVVTGLSGSGKSTLAFETLYAEGQRRYVESLSTYTRQFLDKMPKPDLDHIENIPPAIALEQRNTVMNSRSTVATQTEMLDFLRLFFTKIGTMLCENCRSDVKEISGESLKKIITQIGLKKKFALLAPLAFRSESKSKSTTILESYLSILQEQGFRKVFWSKNKEWIDLESIPETGLPKGLKLESLHQGELFLLMDRFNFSSFEKLSDLDQDTLSRFADSFEQTLRYGHEKVTFLDLENMKMRDFQTGFVCIECNANYPVPSPQLFSFNSPIGACSHCNGFGYTLELDESKIIPHPKRSLNSGAIDPLDKPSAKDEYRNFIRFCQKNGISPTQAYADLSSNHKKLVWSQVQDFFKMLEDYRYKFHVRIFIRRYQSPVKCTSCEGHRLKPESLRIQVRQMNISGLLKMPVSELKIWFETLRLSENEKSLLKELYPQIIRRLDFLCRVGVSYLTLDRLTRTLSGGEFQRINLATHLGNGLCGTLYVLDEPTIGLHPFDINRLIDILRELRDQGNTLVVVEHETKLLEDADWIIELGPDAGLKGGTVIAQGTPEIVHQSSCRTAKFLFPKSKETKRIFPLRKTPTSSIALFGCKENNLKNIDVNFPLQKLVVVTGVSGSGKTTLVHQTLAKALAVQLGERELEEDESQDEELISSIGSHRKMTGHEKIQKLILLDQKPIGKNSRSNPATYMKIWDEVRKIYSHQSLAVARGYTPGYFSFNVDGGRCPTCKGEGEISIDMHFMAEVKLTCEDCEGKRFIKPLLDVTYKNKSVSDLLQTTIDEAFQLFHEHPVLRKKFQLLKDVGLGYLQVGQPGPTLSGGEAQRLKIAHALADENNEQGRNSNDLFILDEPTTGLHQDDVMKLLDVLHQIVDRGKSVILIEHNLDVIANSDFVIDLGQEGGANGGYLVACGSPEELKNHPDSKTGMALRSF